YKIQTSSLVGDANTSLSVLSTDGTTVLLSNDDRSGSDKSSLISFTAPTSGVYFIKSFHGPGLGIYGSYDISVSGNPLQMGSGNNTPSLGVSGARRIFDVGGADAPSSNPLGDFNEGGG